MLWYNVRISFDATPIHLSISLSILPSLVNMSPRYYNSITRGKDLFLNQGEQFTIFQQRTMTLDLQKMNYINYK